MTPWNAGDKATLLVSHTTHIHYAAPVVEAHSEVRKTPVDSSLQRVITHKLEVSPSAPLRSHRDYFGTHVQHFNLLEPHQELTIRADSVVETRDAVCAGHEGAADARPWRQRLAEFLHESPAVPDLPEYAEITHRVSPDLAGDDFLEALRELGGVFRKRFRYDPEATDVHSGPEVLFEKGGGVCQDFAHAVLGAASRVAT